MCVIMCLHSSLYHCQVLTMRETRWYTDDLFGLKTADEAGRILFNTTEGNHLKFSIEQLTWWIENYFIE